MRISTKGRYALRMMIDLAKYHGTDQWIPLKDVSARQGISVKYLEQIVQHLCSAGLLRSLRGPQGGYRLAHAPDQYTAGQIIRAIEGSLAPVACLDAPENQCPRASYCPTLGFWEGLQQVVNDYIDGVSLSDLADREQPQDAYDYSI